MSKSFDAVKFMRNRREEIDKEDEGLTWEERSKKTEELLKDDPIYQRLKDRRVTPSTIRSLVTTKKSD
jgi:hypothetical protein